MSGVKIGRFFRFKGEILKPFLRIFYREPYKMPKGNYFNDLAFPTKHYYLRKKLYLYRRFFGKI